MIELSPAGIERISRTEIRAGLYKEFCGDPYAQFTLYQGTAGGRAAIVQYEPHTDLRDSEQVPLRKKGGIKAFIRRNVLPCTPDTCIKQYAAKVGYEVSFTRHLDKPKPLRTLKKSGADSLAIERDDEGLLRGLLMTGQGT